MNFKKILIFIFFFISLVKSFEADFIREEELEEIINYLGLNPINLNSCSDEEFYLIPFIEETDLILIEKFLKKEKFKSTKELVSLGVVDDYQFSLIKNCIFVDYSERVKIIVENSTKLNLNPQQGFRDSLYLGSRLANKHRFSLKNEICRLNFLGEKDKGEYQFFDNYKYNFILEQKNFEFLLGNYKLKTGSYFYYSESFFSNYYGNISVQKKNNYYSSALSSLDGYNYTGALLEYELDNLSAIAFYNDKKIDASFNENGEISSIVLNGYHRSINEIGKKDNAGFRSLGGGFVFKANNFLSSLFYINQDFSNKLAQDKKYFANDYFIADLAFKQGANFKTGVYGIYSKGKNYNLLSKFQYDQNNSRIIGFLGVYKIAKISYFSKQNFSSDYQKLFKFGFNYLHHDRKSEFSFKIEDDCLDKKNSYFNNKSSELNFSYNLFRKSLVLFSKLKYQSKEEESDSKKVEIGTILRYENLSLKPFLLLQDDNNDYSSLLGFSLKSIYEDFRINGCLINFYAKNTVYRNCVATNFYKLRSFLGNGSYLALNGSYQFIQNFTVALGAEYILYHDKEKIGSGNEEIDHNYQALFELMVSYRK